MKEQLNLQLPKAQIVKQLSSMHAVDIAKQLVELDENEKNDLILLIPSNMIDDVFIELEAEEAINFFNTLDDVKRRVLLTDLSAADLKDLFEEFDEEEKQHFINLLRVDKKIELERLLKYDQTLAASEMRSDYIKLNVNLKASEAMKYIVSNVSDNDYIDILFVLDDENKLIGTIELKDLIIARKNDPINNLINYEYPFVYDNDKLGEAINKIKNYDIAALPVITPNNQLLGIISADDVLEEIALEYESNIDKFVAMGEFDEASSPFKRAYQRLPWLLASIVLNLVIALFLAIFKTTIDTIAALVLFQPLILGMAGNIGTQAIAVTILELHKFGSKDEDILKKHIRKEILIGVINALITGVLGFILAFVFLKIANFQITSHLSIPLFSLVIGLSLFFSMLLSALFGVMIPIVLTKLKIDPAAASGPVISTINDLVALVIYFGFATLIFYKLIYG